MEDICGNLVICGILRKTMRINGDHYNTVIIWKLVQLHGKLVSKVKKDIEIELPKNISISISLQAPNV